MGGKTSYPLKSHIVKTDTSITELEEDYELADKTVHGEGFVMETKSNALFARRFDRKSKRYVPRPTRLNKNGKKSPR
jgi:hypothetical protein